MLLSVVGIPKFGVDREPVSPKRKLQIFSGTQLKIGSFQLKKSQVSDDDSEFSAEFTLELDQLIGTILASEPGLRIIFGLNFGIF